LLKAQTLSLGRPVQIVREHSLDEDVTDQQDPATKAWNFCTALYYKSGQTIPWKLVTDKHRPSVCAVGVSFYRHTVVVIDPSTVDGATQSCKHPVDAGTARNSSVDLYLQ
jgi:hypothetical protein